MRVLTRIAAAAGLAGPLIFGATLLGLSLAEAPFLRSLGWDPLSAPSRDWPSGLALGPQGALMTAVFLLSGALLALFEGEQIVSALGRTGGRASASAKRKGDESPDQLALFGPLPHPIVEELKRLDANEMTPIEALTLVSRLVEQARRG